MKHTLAILLWVVSVTGYSQSEFGLPSVDPDAHLEATQRSAQQGVVLLQAVVTPCNIHQSTLNEDTAITRQNIQGDTLIVEVAFPEQCCVDFDTGIGLYAEDTLNFLYTPYGDGCFCQCCYRLTYYLFVPQKKFKSFMLNGKLIRED